MAEVETEVVDELETETTETETETKWYEGYDTETQEKLNKFESKDDAVNSYLELEKKMGDAVHFPDEKTSEEDREKFNTRIAAYRGVPETAEGYVVEKAVLESPNFDEELLKGARVALHKAGVDQAGFSEALNWWNGVMQARDKFNADIAKASEKALRKKWDNEFDVKVGKEGDEENIGTIKQGLMRMSQILGMDYKDKDGNPQSRLKDCLELDRKKGRLGDKAEVLEMLDWMQVNCFAEGKTFAGEPVSGKGGGKGEDPFEFPEMDDLDVTPQREVEEDLL